ncbi:MAG: aminoglycoside phosphotransferase family protein [Clostridiales bacterium]|nr:aminoglycoside phosphotransferase family protein [Clostridiales bacterium]
MNSKPVNQKELASAFAIDGVFESAKPVGEGHINDTFAFTFINEGKKVRYVIQALNTYVFKEPLLLTDNVVGVTRHINKKIIENGGDPLREGLIVYPARDGKPYYIDSEGRFWRCYNFIENSHSLQSVECVEDFEKAARTFGKFLSLLADYPIETLNETIPNFHNTVSRLADFKKAVEDDISGRKVNVPDEIEFFLSREKDCGVVTSMLDSGALPVRVTHNDTKLNNIMFDNDTNEGICVVDLDTVMPGSSLYDFGDSIRFGASSAAEDEKDLDKVHFLIENFEAFTRGWLECAGKSLTENEIKYLPFSAKLMTLECGMRFLGDYLNGDVYFKTDYPDHNLVRARTHIKLVREMEENMPLMEVTVLNIRRNLGI